MITRTYHYYLTKRDSGGRAASYEEGDIRVVSWFPRPAGEILEMLRDNAQRNGLNGEKVVVESLSRIS